MKKKWFLVIIILFNVVFMKSSFSFGLEGIKTEGYQINILNNEDLPFNQFVIDLYSICDKDANGFPITYYNGNQVDDIFEICRIGLSSLSYYLMTGSQNDLNNVLKTKDKLLSISLTISGKRYFSNNYQYEIHTGIFPNSPWISAKSQGMVLLFFSRLYIATGNNTYLNFANEVYRTYWDNQNESEYWFSYIDNDNYLWVEEFPFNDPEHTMNGMIVSIFGLYEYYRATNNIETRDFIRCLIKTILNNINVYRVPNQLSFSCLKHKQFLDINGQEDRIDYYNLLFKITDQVSFQVMAQNMENDLKYVLENTVPPAQPVYTSPQTQPEESEGGGGGCFLKSLI